ncbi:MAG: Peptidoglycan-N-acetylglucosamine deacetylase [Candidatus Dichloromethanomonas elyunquensis]|nr:MAG: Peptidoglycan-N-acetylglucosamine deacetylase [Candidatus Dichloromethanomonas elyunquensis]
MKKGLILGYIYVLSLTILISLAPQIKASGISENHFSTVHPETSQTAASDKINNSDPSSQPVLQSAAHELAGNAFPVKNTVCYEIRGTSNQLSKKNVQSLAKWKQQITDFSLQNNNVVYLNGETDERAVALTFDDGPDAVVTPAVLDIFKSYGEHGSFFFIGQNVKAFPAVVQRAYQEGNLVLNHSYSHPDFSDKSSNFITGEINRTNEIIKNVIGKVPSLIRPPYGIINENVVKIGKNQNIKLIIWSIDTFDWSQREAGHIAQNVLENVRPGDIVLMHSNSDKSQTLKALPQIIEGLHAKGYKIVTLDNLLHTSAYQN